jgi:hypothetical protein
MQSMPVYATFEGLTIFRDDADISRFFYLPRTLKIKADPTGKPMFTFLKYTLPIERQSATDKGGGYLVFTTELFEDPKFLNDKILPFLSSRMSAENPNVPSLPPPVLSAMDFTSGEVRLLLMKDDRFVSQIQAGKPSLFADNTASFSVELKDLGADLFYQALKKGAGIAVVEYDLGFDIRLPAIHVHAHADSTEIHDATMKYSIEHVQNEDTWGNTSDTDVHHRSSVSETMESMGLIQLTIDTGTSQIKDEDVAALRAFAFSKLDDWVKEHFLKGGQITTAQDRESAWMTSIHEDIHQTFNLDLVQRSVIQRMYNPSAQMTEGFLGGKIADLVLDIDLGTAAWFFNNLDVQIDTNLDFTKYGDIVHSVVGHFTYEGTTKDGDNIVKRESFVFTAADVAPKHFKTRLAAVGADTYQVEVEVHYKSGPVTSAILVSESTNVRDYTLSVPNPGVMQITVAAQDKAAFTDSKLSSIEVEIKYGDPDHNVPEAVGSVVLTKDKDTVDYMRTIYAPWDKPYFVRRTYVVNDAGNTQRITTDWEQVNHDPGQPQHHLTIGTPFDTLFNLTVMASADWGEVLAVLLDLEYVDDANDYRQKNTFSFSKEASGMPSVWKFPLRDPKKRAYRYSQKLLMLNSAATPGKWQPAASDADTLIVGNALGGVISIKVDPGDTGVGTKLRRVVVKLHYDDAPNSVHHVATLVFRDTTSQVWTFATADPKATAYSYDVEYVSPDGTSLHLNNQPGTIGGISDFLFLAPPPPIAQPVGGPAQPGAPTTPAQPGAPTTPAQPPPPAPPH